MSNINTVHQVVKHVHKLRRHRGQCQAEEQLTDPLRAEESVVVLHENQMLLIN